MQENSYLAAWFDGMESRPTYRGTQSDFHTHAHDLPPQMGGCIENGEPKMLLNKNGWIMVLGLGCLMWLTQNRKTPVLKR
jgi:hypothetical protein